jgi:hypothetical protein
MPLITINDETVSGAKSQTLELDITAGTITLRELIASRVEEEVRRYNAQKRETQDPPIFHGLVQPSDSEQILNGYRMRKARPVDPVAQIQRALEAFEGNGFFVLVDDRQVESLDEPIEIGLKTQVSFIKLLPLVGG